MNLKKRKEACKYEKICWQKMEGINSIITAISKEIVQVSEHNE